MLSLLVCPFCHILPTVVDTAQVFPARLHDHVHAYVAFS